MSEKNNAHKIFPSKNHEKKSLATDYEIIMITASLDGTNAQATDHKIDRAGIYGCGYATSTRTTLNQCATIRLNVVW